MDLFWSFPLLGLLFWINDLVSLLLVPLFSGVMLLFDSLIYSKPSNIVMGIQKVVSIYILFSCTLIITSTAYANSPSTLVFVSSSIIGGVFLLGAQYEGIINKFKKKTYYDEQKLFGTHHLLTIDEALCFLSVSAFIIGVFIPQLGYNPISAFIAQKLIWLARIPYVGIVLNVFGALTCLVMIKNVVLPTFLRSILLDRSRLLSEG